MSKKKRNGVSPKVRFEVLKRDRFTCQYCGITAIDHLLHVDHVKPVVEGGSDDPLNLVTSCRDCNLGKGARPLEDNGYLRAQHKQLADLEERRQQMELMRQWQVELESHKGAEVDVVEAALAARTKQGLTETGRTTVRKIIKKHGLGEVLAALGEALDLYYSADRESLVEAFAAITKVLSWREKEKAVPGYRRLLYIQGILRNRFRDPVGDFISLLSDGVAKGHAIEKLEANAKKAKSWPHFVEICGAPPSTAHDEEDEDDFSASDRDQFEAQVAWSDPCWAIDLWSGCFTNESARVILEEVAYQSLSGGRFEHGKISEEDLRMARGLRAVGLVQPITPGTDIAHRDERGNLTWSFRIMPMTPREASNAFNRLGALKLGFWWDPRVFASVQEIH